MMNTPWYRPNRTNVQAAPCQSPTTNQKIASAAVTNSTVIGLIHDRDALGYAWLNPHTLVSPLNSAGQYYNEDYHARFATLSDNTEKAVVICLDKVGTYLLFARRLPTAYDLARVLYRRAFFRGD